MPNGKSNSNLTFDLLVIPLGDQWRTMPFHAVKYYTKMLTNICIIITDHQFIHLKKIDFLKNEHDMIRIAKHNRTYVENAG